MKNSTANRPSGVRRGLRSLTAGGLTLAAAFALTAVTGTPASAHYSQCPDKKFCIWQHSSYEGMFAYSSEPQPNVGEMNDRTTSYWNRTDNWVTLYLSQNYVGCFESVPPGGSTAAINPIWNDSLTSFRPGKFC